MRVAFGLLLLSAMTCVSAMQAASDPDNRERLLQAFSVAPVSTRATANTLEASAKNAPANSTEMADRRYVRVPVVEPERAMVTVVNGSVGGLWPNAGVKNAGVAAHQNGRTVGE